MQNLWVIRGWCNLKIEVTKSPARCIIAEGKCVSLLPLINFKSTDPVQKFYAEGTNSMATGHFSYQLGFWGAVITPPPPPPSTSKNVQYKLGASIFGTNKDRQFEEGTSSVLAMTTSLWQAVKINQLENVERNL